MDSKTLTIFSQQLAGYLMLHRFVLIGMRPDNTGSGRNLFFFNNSEEIQKAIKEFKK